MTTYIGTVTGRLVSQERAIGMRQIIIAGWKGAFAAIRQNVLLFVSAFLGLVAVQFAIQFLLPMQNSKLSGFSFSRYWFVRAAILLVLNSACMAPCMVAVHRFVLMHEAKAVFVDKRRLAIFYVVLMAVRALPYSIWLPNLNSLVRVLLWVISIWATIKLTLIFPEIALDRATPLKDSWRRTSNHWWFIFGVILFGLMIIGCLSTALEIELSPNNLSGIHFRHQMLLFLALTAFLDLGYPVVGAALASELFKKYGGLEESISTVK